METMKKSTLTIFCILAGCIFVLSGIWIYFQKNLDRVELGEGERATAYQRHYLMIANDKDTGMWQSVYESASKEAESKDAYVELLSPEQMNGYSQADCLKIGIASKVDGIILEADGSKEEQHLITEALKDGIPVVTVMTDDTATSRISFVGLNSYQMGSAYTEQIQGMLKEKGSTSVMFLSTSSSKTQETNLVYSQVKKELECVCQALVDYNQVGNVKVIGYYYSNVTLDAIDKGIISSAIALDMEEIGRYSVNALDEYISFGHSNNYYSVDQHVITKDNTREYRTEDEK